MLSHEQNRWKLLPGGRRPRERKDGMNLVAKEYCAANIEAHGVLILSEFAGAAAQLQKGALMVNPYDVEGVADTLYRAFLMPQAQRRARMRKLRRAIREYDIFWWVDSFLRAVIAKDLADFPQPGRRPLFREPHALVRMPCKVAQRPRRVTRFE